MNDRRPLPLPPVAAPFQLPFHYGALHNIGVDFLTDAEPARKLLAQRHPALAAADFGGRACVSVNYQLYFAQYPNGGGITQEIEINLIAHPAGEEHRVAAIGYQDYARGIDQTKLLGIARLHVLCDNPLAIDAGRLLYAEPKHPGSFETVMPSLNGPTDHHAWSIICKTPEGAPLLTLDADLAGLDGEPVNSAPVTGYGTDAEQRLLAGPMNVYHPYRYHPLDTATADRVRLTVTAPDHPAGADLQLLLGDAAAVGAWTYQSAPVAAHNRPYYLPSR
ncbi:hypothetical protein [Streptacidiphilus sp. MAP5-3]|uniref:hypothetical protein n=1 Tax=unclassified Streptacidiphilus TaxID=2643834 RepID=UPI00351242AE